jgi:hypothetical protein
MTNENSNENKWRNVIEESKRENNENLRKCLQNIVLKI